MSKLWSDVKQSLEAEIDAITWQEPPEVKMSRLGVFPSGAGVNGQYLGNMLFQLADTRGLGLSMVGPAMNKALANKDLSVEHCKLFFTYMSGHTIHLMGAEAPPNCPAPWMNLPKVMEFYHDILDSFPSITRKEQLEDLLWSWFNYMERLHRWFWLKYPWEVGDAFPLKTAAET